MRCECRLAGVRRVRDDALREQLHGGWIAVLAAANLHLEPVAGGEVRHHGMTVPPELRHLVDRDLPVAEEGAPVAVRLRHVHVERRVAEGGQRSLEDERDLRPAVVAGLVGLALRERDRRGNERGDERGDEREKDDTELHEMDSSRGWTGSLSLGAADEKGATETREMGRGTH